MRLTFEFSRGTQVANEPPRYINVRGYNILNTFTTLSRIDVFIDCEGSTRVSIIMIASGSCVIQKLRCKLFAVWIQFFYFCS